MAIQFLNNGKFPDNAKLNFGNSSDLQIYHDGSHSYIQDTSGTGDLRIDTNAFRLRSANGGESMITAFEDSAVNLMFNTFTKLSTTSTGVTVTGDVSANNMITGFDDSGSSTVTLTLTQQDGGTLTTSFVNPQGTVTSVATGSGLVGGTIIGSGTISVDYTSNGLVADAPGGGGLPDEDDLLLVGKDSTGTGETRSYAISDVLSLSGSMSNWNLTADIGGSFSVGQGTTVDIAGGTNISTTRTGATVQINNSITNNNQLTNGAGYTTNTGTVTGSGSSGQIAIFNGSSSLTSNSGLTEISTGVLYANTQFQVKGIQVADYTVNGDTDTGLGSFDGANGVSLVSKGKKEITVKEGDITFNTYDSTSVATTGSLNPNQSNQAPTQDTLAQLCVDPSGNVVRGEQEGTWTFTRAQLNAALNYTLISAPGTDKGIIVTESDWMIKFSSTGSAVSGNQTYDIRQANYATTNATISTLPGARINEIIGISGTVPNPSYGWVSRDIPLTTRTYKTNVATTLNKKTNDQLPTNVVSISIKLKYRIFDADTF